MPARPSAVVTRGKGVVGGGDVLTMGVVAGGVVLGVLGVVDPVLGVFVVVLGVVDAVLGVLEAVLGVVEAAGVVLAV